MGGKSVNVVVVIEGEQIVEAARQFLGVRFRLHGRDRRGMDCVGLVLAVGRHFGVDAEFTDYDRSGLSTETVERFMLDHGFKAVPVSAVAKGDIVTGLSLNATVQALSIVSDTGQGGFAGITRVIHVDTFSDRGAFRLPRLCVVEDRATERDVRELQRSLRSYGLSLDDTIQRLRVFRFPFAKQT